MNKATLLKAATDYMKKNKLKGDVLDYMQTHKAEIMAFQKANEKNCADLSGFDEKEQVELMNHLDAAIAKAQGEAKKQIEKIQAESKVRCDKLKADTEKSKQAAAAIKKANTFLDKKNAAAVSGDVFDNRRCDFGTPDSIHRAGDSAYIFAKNKRGVETQTAIPLKNLLKHGTDTFLRSIGTNFSDKLVKQLYAIEESLRYETTFNA